MGRTHIEIGMLLLSVLVFWRASVAIELPEMLSMLLMFIYIVVLLTTDMGPAGVIPVRYIAKLIWYVYAN